MITPYSKTIPPLKGTYSWISDDMVKFRAASKEAGNVKESFSIKSIDDSILMVEAPGRPDSSLTFTRMSK
jgi:hypothetical protein